MRSIPALQPIGGGTPVLAGDRPLGRRRRLSLLFGVGGATVAELEAQLAGDKS
jgi:hypothetical protein